MKKRRTGAGTIAALTLACVLGATMLLSLAAGASIYRRVSDRVERASGERVGLTYITAKIQGGDVAGSVYAAPFGDVDAVWLLEEAEDGLVYETILYVCDGYLMEMFCEQGWEQDPKNGQPITEAQSMTAAEIAPGLLRLTYTDASGRVGTADIYLRGDQTTRIGSRSRI